MTRETSADKGVCFCVMVTSIEFQVDESSGFGFGSDILRFNASPINRGILWRGTLHSPRNYLILFLLSLTVAPPPFEGRARIHNCAPSLCFISAATTMTTGG